MKNFKKNVLGVKFETEGVVDKKLEISEEFLAEKYKDRLEASYKVKIKMAYH